MKRRHLVVFYGSLLVPVGTLLGSGVGSVVGGRAVMTLVGAAVGCLASYLLVRASAAGDSP